MHPDQIKNAAKELFETVLCDHRPANDIINAYTRSRRYIGSKDRKALTDLVWKAVRHQARLNFLFPNLSRAEQIDFLDQADLIPDSAPDWVKWEIPSFLQDEFARIPLERKALDDSAPIVLRSVKNRNHIRALLLKEGIETEPTPHSPFGLILKKRTNLNACAVYRQGLIEIQDEGSQLVALETEIQPNDRVLDYCAGAGGKTLIFAQMMQQKGIITAYDIDSLRLKNLLPRAKRAGCSHMIKITPQKPAETFSHVVVDAPCSGSGTWRRCPDAKWKLTQERFFDLLKIQANILRESASFVEKGKKLSYMTCSLFSRENDDQIQTFLEDHPDFSLLKMKHFTPATTNTDGFFVAVMQKN